MAIIKKNITVFVFFFWVVSILIFIITRDQAFGGSVDVLDKVNGIWMFDEAHTMKLRIIKGVPWHIGDRYGMGGGGKVIREFENNVFRFYDEKTSKIVDKGKYQVIESDKNEVLLRIFPEKNRFGANEYQFEELVRFSRFPGENVPYIIGVRFIDDNSAESFSYVRDFGKDKMIEKDDNAYWRRIKEIPKPKGGLKGRDSLK